MRYYLIWCVNCRMGCFHKQRQTNIFYFLHSISIRYNNCITNGFTALITSVAGCGWPSLGGLALLFQPVTIYLPSPFTRPRSEDFLVIVVQAQTLAPWDLGTFPNLNCIQHQSQRPIWSCFFQTVTAWFIDLDINVVIIFIFTVIISFRYQFICRESNY